MIKNLLKKPHIIIIGILLIGGLILSAKAMLGNNIEAEKKEEVAQKVKTVKLELNGHDKAVLETVGTVKAKTRIDVVALSKGTVRNIFFSVNDKVFQNQALASLSDSLTLTNLISAETNFANMQNNQIASERLANETVRQAELGVQAALDSVEAAEIGVNSARDNLNNYLALRDKSNEDAKTNAVVSYFGYLNSVFSALDQINTIIKVDESALSPGSILLDPSIGAKNLSALPSAKLSYKNAKTAYDNIKNITPNNNTIDNDLSALVSAMEKTEIAVSDMINLLNNTVTGLDLTETWLNAQKSNFIGLRSSMVISVSTAKATMQTLQNISLINTQDESSLNNAILSAENRLSTARISYENSLVALENTKQGSSQQKISAQISLDSSRSQLNLSQIQAGDLSIRAPITGKITKRTIELGAQLSPGTKIAEISQTDLLTIETDISAEDVLKIKLNEEVKLLIFNEELTGIITKIFPSADPITKKVRVEIAYDNKDNKLIPEAFVNVIIPLQKKIKNKKSLFIPLRAVIINANENYVFTVTDGHASKTVVNLGETRGTEVEILNGLNNTDELIVEGAKIVEDAEKVEIIK
ncbi:MAG: efflux RND transporter periplasmic adaptor subunit [Patescibacteria group bacterium]|nr:efflux RND transporter periplasmic adaptor subunit [Patescibacteria group bacterium]